MTHEEEMTNGFAQIVLVQLNTDKQLNVREHEAIRVAIKSLEQIEKIKSIINDPFYFRGMPAYMQEDVLKYKVICELLKEDRT